MVGLKHKRIAAREKEKGVSTIIANIYYRSHLMLIMVADAIFSFRSLLK